MQCASSTTSIPAVRGELGQHLVAELGVVQALGADEQDVDLAGLDLAVDQRPVVGVGGVDRHRVDAGAVGGLDLVAHEREQRADDHRRALPARPEQRGGHEVDRRLAPPGALHHQRPPALGHQRVDRRPLVLAQRGVGPGQALQRGLGVGAQIGLGRDGHGSMVDDGSDRPGGAVGPRGVRVALLDRGEQRCPRSPTRRRCARSSPSRRPSSPTRPSTTSTSSPGASSTPRRSSCSPPPAPTAASTSRPAATPQGRSSCSTRAAPSPSRTARATTAWTRSATSSPTRRSG